MDTSIDGCMHTTEVMAIYVRFCLFWPKFGCHGNVA